MKINIIETLFQIFNPNYQIPLYVQKIKQIRTALKQTKNEFAATLGYVKNPIPYYLIEAGIQTIDYEFIQKLCYIYNVDANWFLGLMPDVQKKEKKENENEN